MLDAFVYQMRKLILSLFLVAFVLSACASPATQAIPKLHESCTQGSIAHPPFFDLNTNGDFRAATIAFFNDGANGMSFLVRSSGILKVITIEHMAELAHDKCAYIYISGAKGPSGKPLLGTVDYNRFTFSGPKSDRVATYAISTAFAEVLETEIKNGSLIPLELSIYDPKPGDEVAIPRTDTGRNTIYTIIGKSANGFWIAKTNGSQGIICEGRSGGPVLATSGNVVTRQVVGVVSSISQEKGDLYFDDLGRACSLVLYFAPVR